MMVKWCIALRWCQVELAIPIVYKKKRNLVRTEYSRIQCVVTSICLFWDNLKSFTWSFLSSSQGLHSSRLIQTDPPGVGRCGARGRTGRYCRWNWCWRFRNGRLWRYCNSPQFKLASPNELFPSSSRIHGGYDRWINPYIHCSSVIAHC